jgi:hypothetical protein
MSHTYSSGDRGNDSGSRYGTCCREQYDCNACEDTGVCGPDKAASREYCDCALGRDLQRMETGD